MTLAAGMTEMNRDVVLSIDLVKEHEPIAQLGTRGISGRMMLLRLRVPRGKRLVLPSSLGLELSRLTTSRLNGASELLDLRPRLRQLRLARARKRLVIAQLAAHGFGIRPQLLNLRFARRKCSALLAELALALLYARLERARRIVAGRARGPGRRGIGSGHLATVDALLVLSRARRKSAHLRS